MSGGVRGRRRKPPPTRSEGIILKSLKESAEEKTIVLVSHRVSTMNMADVVYEMENGRIS